jgi:hypothetical protein
MAANEEYIDQIKKLHVDAMDLLENINKTITDEKTKTTLNSLMPSVVKNLNDAIISEMTGKEEVK